MSGKERVAYLDLLRVFSILAVMVLHVSGQSWAVLDVHSAEWRVLTFYDGICRWGAPLFVMISGALMLDRDRTGRQLVRKSLRLVAAFLFWSAVYALVESRRRPMATRELLLEIAAGHYHMWFLFMILGLYLITPFLRRIVASRRLTEYFLLLALIFNFAIPQSLSLAALLNPALAEAAGAIVNKIYFHFALGFAGFYVLGYALSRAELSRGLRWALGALSLAGFAVTVGLTTLLSWRQGAADERVLTYFSLNALLESVGVFLLFRYCSGWTGRLGERGRRVLRALSEGSFGAYLIHPLVLEFLDGALGLRALSFAPALSVPAITLLVFAVSYALTFALRRIPGVGRILV